MSGDRFELQKTCEHQSAIVVAEPTVEEEKYAIVKIAHFHCLRCGMFFGKEVKRRAQSEKWG